MCLTDAGGEIWKAEGHVLNCLEPALYLQPLVNWPRLHGDAERQQILNRAIFTSANSVKIDVQRVVIALANAPGLEEPLLAIRAKPQRIKSK